MLTHLYLMPRLSRLAATAGAIMVAFGVVGSAPAQAVFTKCTYNHYVYGKQGYWHDPTTGNNVSSIPLYVNTGSIPSGYSQTAVLRRITDAAHTWSKVRNKCHFRNHGKVPAVDLAPSYSTTASPTSLRDGLNTIGWTTPVVCNHPLFSSCTQARWNRPKDTIIYEFGIQISTNPNYHFWMSPRPMDSAHAGYYDFWSTMAHEIGHGLGFGHVSNDGRAADYVKQQIMYAYTYHTTIYKRYLGGSDYAGLCKGYGC